MVAVSVSHVTKRFGTTTAVSDVSLASRKGELFFLLGPSGCGKSTLLRMIAGLCQADEGEIRFDDRRMNEVPPHKRNTGMVFQSYALWPHMTVWENVGYGLDVRKVRGDEKAKRIQEALEIVRMARFAERRPNQLSGGEQQRVALARALVINPDVILLDEPLSNLDAKLRLEMRAEIKRIHSETGITTLYVTHDQKEALSMAQRVAVMNAGRVEQVGTPREIYDRPLNRFVAEFVGETNFFEGRIVQRQGAALTIACAFGTVLSQSNSGALPDEVLCAVRPEALRLVSGSAATGQNAFPARVRALSYLGESEQYELDLAGGVRLKLVSLNPKSSAAPVGAEVAVSFDPADVIVLARE